jgi:uncharacterized cupredoxin-like copper-binding protein
MSRRCGPYPRAVISQRTFGLAVLVLAVGGALALAGCDAGPAVTPAITPGTASHPRAVVILAKDYAFIPPIVDLVPGETVVFQVINGGLIAHEAVIGSPALQLAWETAEAPTASAPPGPTPAISIPPSLAATGLRIVVGSGQRADVTWQVPLDAASGGSEWLVACHIPGHLAAGMLVPVRFVGPGGVPLGSPPASASVVP